MSNHADFLEFNKAMKAAIVVDSRWVVEVVSEACIDVLVGHSQC